MPLFWNERGVTLLEMLIVVVLMTVMVGTTYFYLGNRGARAQLKSDVRDVVSHMKLARGGAIRDCRPWALVFDTANRRYRVYSDSGENVGSEDWDDGDETVYRTIRLSELVVYGSQKGMRPGATSLPTDGVSFTSNRVVFNPDGTSQSGTVYLTVPDGATMAAGSRSTTGMVKIWKNYGSGWTD